MALNFACFSCRQELSFTSLPIGLREECPHCRADVHVCKNCDFYDPKVYNECRESAADRVKEKERANFCDHFVPRKSSLPSEQAAAALKAAAEALFKKT